MNTLLGLDTDELTALAESLGAPAFRGRQLARWLYQTGVRSIEEMTTLPRALRDRLSVDWMVGRSRLRDSQKSSDGTSKLLLEMNDGELVETVGMPYEDRFSCCVSTQVGCAMKCIFCATGLSGFSRNLSAGEILDQVMSMREALKMQTGDAVRISHVVFMGMGEPLLNYDATLKAVRLLNQEMGISMRHITLSTIGIVPRILELADRNLQLTLAVSLHAPTDELRRKLIPTAAKWTVAEIVAACRTYVRLTGRRVTFEYCLIDGLNDSVSQARDLVNVLHGLNCHVNLIRCNTVSDTGCRPSRTERVSAFRQLLETSGITVTQRMERGAGIDAACGQLRRRILGAGARAST